MIAHRLSTVIKADNIVVLQGGKVVQQGTHDELMTDITGHYFDLANAQQLSSSEDSASTSKVVDPEKQDVPLDISEDFKLEPILRFEKLETAPKNLTGSFALFLWEQKYQWRWYVLMIIGALGAGGKSFQVTPMQVAISYFILGWSSNVVSFVSEPPSPPTENHKAKFSIFRKWLQHTAKNTSAISSCSQSPTTITPPTL